MFFISFAASHVSEKLNNLSEFLCENHLRGLLSSGFTWNIWTVNHGRVSKPQLELLFSWCLTQATKTVTETAWTPQFCRIYTQKPRLKLVAPCTTKSKPWPGSGRQTYYNMEHGHLIQGIKGTLSFELVVIWIQSNAAKFPQNMQGQLVSYLFYRKPWEQHSDQSCNRIDNPRQKHLTKSKSQKFIGVFLEKVIKHLWFCSLRCLIL